MFLGEEPCDRLTYRILWESCLSVSPSDFCSPGKRIWEHLEADLDSFQRDDKNTLWPRAKQVLDHSWLLLLWESTCPSLLPGAGCQYHDAYLSACQQKLRSVQERFSYVQNPHYQLKMTHQKKKLNSSILIQPHHS